MKKERSFRERVLAVVARIPKGKYMTYAEVAKRAGSPRAYRAVGTIMATNRDRHIPCHRVVHSDGTVGAYNGLRGTDKQALLQAEGVRLD